MNIIINMIHWPDANANGKSAISLTLNNSNRDSKKHIFTIIYY